MQAEKALREKERLEQEEADRIGRRDIMNKIYDIQN
jgi:hypothetical protein